MNFTKTVDIVLPCTYYRDIKWITPDPIEVAEIKSNGQNARGARPRKDDPPKSAEEKDSSVTFGIYKIDHKGEKTSVKEIEALLGKNPFSELGVEPDPTDYGIYYRDLYNFNVDEDNAELYKQMADMFCNLFKKIEKYFCW